MIRSMWADYFEKQNITYAFFSAADAAAAQEQAERMWRRENDIDSESEDEEEEADEASDGASEEEEEEDDEEAEDAEEDLSRKVESTTLDSDYEEGWSTEGEDDDEVEEGGAIAANDKKVTFQEKIPMKDIVAEVNERIVKEQQAVAEDDRTRVLSVTELEDLFVNAAPDLNRQSSFHPSC
jgi:large subunit GTPase 1